MELEDYLVYSYWV